MKASTPRGLRLHIGIFGRRNTGKSSLLNAVTHQEVSIVSHVPGTTTDPVEKPMELLPLGPVLFIDTAGIDDAGALGELRIEKTRTVLDRTDLGVIVCGTEGWGEFEEDLLTEFRQRQTGVVVVFNKTDLVPAPADTVARLSADGISVVESSVVSGRGIPDFRQALLANAPAEFFDSQDVLSDIVRAGELAVLVVPIDKGAPRGRLIMPQVQTIRNLLDNDAYCLVVKERELKAALSNLRVAPKLVVTDSQAFLKVAADTPPEVLMTSFSILFARLKGDLAEMVKGALSIDALRPGDEVLIAETCAHHPIADDIGRVKIPRWLTEYVGGKLSFTHTQGHNFPEDLGKYKLVIHCGACMWNRKEMLSRIWRCQLAKIPITNYGLTVAYSLGVFERALTPFTAVAEMYQTLKGKSSIQGCLR